MEHCQCIGSFSKLDWMLTGIKKEKSDPEGGLLFVLGTNDLPIETEDLAEDAIVGEPTPNPPWNNEVDYSLDCNKCRHKMFCVVDASFSEVFQPVAEAL